MEPTELDLDELEARLADLHEASFGWACSCCGWNESDAADVLQDAYVKVISGRARFDGRSSFRTWLFGVIRLTALEGHRRARSRRDGRDRLAEQAAAADAAVSRPEDPAVRSEEARILREALDLLPARQQEVLHLVFYEDMTVRMASEVMGISVGSARVHYHRGKERLRTLLAAPTPEGGTP
jgi:RNA polymerase sigma-70 factor (ECF subfamily)